MSQQTLMPSVVRTKLGLFAGEGELPVSVALNAMAQGHDVTVYALDKSNMAAFQKAVGRDKVHWIRPGLLNQNVERLHAHGVAHVVFAGKVNKWILLRSPMLDSRAWALWKAQQHFNDDSIMLTLIRELEREGITVLRQTDYMANLLVAPGLYSERPLTEEEQKDVAFGMALAKEMGRLDVGQTVVVCNRMAIAIEAIEGTDQAILRAKKWVGRKGGVVAKVEKPNQDLRFDVPTVGPRTLRAMRKSGLKVLAVEAGKTIVMDLESMTRLANRWQMSIVAV